jgi:hypothetical protein
MLNDLPVDKVNQLIIQLIQRLISEYTKCSELCLNSQIKGNSYLFNCLHILDCIVSNESYLKE